ncbi:phosphatidate cytidylyltransferase [Peptoniphilus equinus]|uniref:Phosphatidate cytidylyltransferase n=1 Tax=Peptoniphilus equinus TaxID=3016343 RepID=A0ABY7QWC2_9FIRM|nr:phosphatidate cytidylyltransferase [Peptoniphilus equinus]WBW50671.1 phosphatidate cytidylyltransferase [Peptoniphilus equinus]
MGDLQKRLTTAIVGIGILGVVIYFGGLALRLTVTLVSLISLFELRLAFKKININLNMTVLVIGLILLQALDHYSIGISLSASGILILSFIFSLFLKRYTIEDGVYTLFSFIYIPVVLHLLYKLDNSPFMLLVFVIAFSTDTFAYAIGSTIGRIKLIPEVSPKKSVEGFIGGILGALICSLIFFYFVKLPISPVAVLFVVVASIAGQIGDLAASKVKRICGIKDYSHLLPGHGGMLDRIDSILFITPVVYILLNIMAQ